MQPATARDSDAGGSAVPVMADAAKSADAGGSAHAGDSSDDDAGDSARAGDSTDAGDSVHAGDSPDETWALSVLASVIDLAQSSLPTVDSLLGINASMMLSPHLIQHGEDWTESVSKDKLEKARSIKG